jgi:beta-glucanase (GH16 family)
LSFAFFGALALAGCALTGAPAPVRAQGPLFVLDAQAVPAPPGGLGPLPAVPGPAAVPTPAAIVVAGGPLPQGEGAPDAGAESSAEAPEMTPAGPWNVPVIEPDFAFDLSDNDRWFKADGWANGEPFLCGWRADHVLFEAGRVDLSITDRESNGRPYSGGEIRSVEAVPFGRVEGRLKAAKGSGVVTSLFTYTGPAEGTVHDEVDIEILGKDTTKLQVNYFTEGVGGHEVVIPLGFDAAEGFHDYAFEWTATAIRWYVDGKLVHTEDGSRGPLPKTPGRVMANLWPGVGVDGWLGPFDYPGTPVTAQYERIGYRPF